MSLKQRVPFLRWSFWRLAIGARNITKTGQIGDGREAAAADYVVANARQGDIDDVIAKVDEFAYEKSILINVGDEKGELLDAAVRRANPGLALELGTYCGYGSLRIARAARPRWSPSSCRLPTPKWRGAFGRMPASTTGSPVWSARSATAAGHSTRWPTSTVRRKLDLLFIDHDKGAYLPDLQSILDRVAAPRVDRGRRQHSDSGVAEVPRVHARAAGQALRHGRTQDPRRVSDAGSRCRAGVGVPKRLTVRGRSASPCAWTAWPYNR